MNERRQPRTKYRAAKRKNKQKNPGRFELFLHKVCWGVQKGGGGLDRTSAFRGGLLGKSGVTFFRGCNFHIKNKLKSHIFNDKKKFPSKNIFPS